MKTGEQMKCSLWFQRFHAVQAQRGRQHGEAAEAWKLLLQTRLRAPRDADF